MQSGSLLLLVVLITFSAEPALSGQPDVCHLPKDKGPCKGYILRYFFNTNTKKCEKFIYGGCHGNANNFNNLKECCRTCKGKC